NVNDESDRDGMRLVIDLKRDANASVVMNNLFQHTQLQTTFGVNMLAIVDGRPEVLSLKKALQYFIKFRNEVIVRRTQYDLDEAEKRAHILEGFIIALDNIDEVIALIKKSKDVESAKDGLMKRFKLSEIQARAILEMRLQRLTGLERKKIQDEYKEVIKLIEKLKAILANKQLQMQIIKEELQALREKYGDERRTEIIMDKTEFNVEDLIAEEDVVVTISYGGFIKRFPVSGYRRQGRGGKGVTGATTKEDDFIEKMFIASTHDYLLIFTNTGRCYWLKVFEIPEAGRTARGRAIINLLQMQNTEKIAAVLSVKEFDDKHFIMMVSKQGVIKKSSLENFSNPRANGIIAMGLDDKDAVVDVKLTDGTNDIVLGTHEGIAIRFHEDEVRSMGRTASGVRGIRLEKGDYVIGAVTTKRSSTTILVAAENGFGKRTDISDYRVSHRGGKGIYTLKANDKTGKMVAIKETFDNDDIVVVSTGGMVIRQHASDIRVTGRNTQGVRIIRLDEGDMISALAIVPSEENENLEEKENGTQTDLKL
ncbi:MAG: DNA gyrase subunit A, partial [Ignavibacteriales bacterium]|nr:DNA gyrase subunit A [Ignavibacteriales bacterium]